MRRTLILMLETLFLGSAFALCPAVVAGATDSVQRDTQGITTSDTLHFRVSADTLYRYRIDTLRTIFYEDNGKVRKPSLRTNLAYAASSTPNLGFEVPLGRHLTLGANGGVKPWPRWDPRDTDVQNPTKWRHILVAPELRWWTGEVYDKWFLGLDLIYTHYNVGSVTFPFGLYPDVREHRLQGDFYGAGIFAGRSWYLGNHFRLETEIGVGAGYKDAYVYECSHCGAQIDHVTGPAIIPKIGINLAYDLDKRRIRKELIDILQTPFDTLIIPEPVAPPQEFVPVVPDVEERGVAGELAPKHPILRHNSEYRPYTPDRILRKEEGALYVFFEWDKWTLLRSFTEGGNTHDNGPVLDEIIEITSKIMADTTSSVSKIQLIGLASVEGSITHNNWLASTRAIALQRYIQERLEVPDELFETIGGGEAWSELRDMVNDALLEGGDGGLTADQLRKVLEIIDSEPDANRREAALKRLESGQVYRILLQNFMHNLRNSGYIRIYFDYVPDKGAQEINRAIDYMEAGDNDTALRILEGKRGDSRSDNAYAVALFNDGREDEALTVLEAAAARGDEAAARNLAQLRAIRAQRSAYEAYLSEWEEYTDNINNNH